MPLFYNKIKSCLAECMVYKRRGDFRIGLEISCNLPFPAAGKQGVRESSSQGNHVTNITLAHFFLIEIVFNFKLLFFRLYLALSICTKH